MKLLWRAGCLGKLSVLVVGSIAVILGLSLLYALAILAIQTWAAIGIPVALILGLMFYFIRPVRQWFARKFPQFAEQILLKKSSVAAGLSAVLVVSSLAAMQVRASLPAPDSTTATSTRIAVSLPTHAPVAVVTVLAMSQSQPTQAPEALALMQTVPTEAPALPSAIPTLVAPTPTLASLSATAVEQSQVAPTQVAQAPVQPTAPAPAEPTEAPASVNVSLTPRVTAPQNVNLRSGPGQNYPVVSAIYAGVSVDMIGRNDDGTWLLVNMNGMQAWVSRQVVTAEGQVELVAVAPAPPPPAPVEAPIEVAPVQAAPVDSAPVQVAVEPVQSQPVVAEPVVAQPIQPDPITPEPVGFISQPAPAPVVEAGNVSSQCVGVAAGARYGAICEDGTSSTATGLGACSHHGGVANWLTCS